MRKSIAPWAALAGSLALTCSAAAIIVVHTRTRDHARFARAIREVEARIESRVEMNAALLRGAAALEGTQPETTAEEFHRYVERLDLPHRAAGMEGIGFIRRVHRADSPVVEAELAGRGFAGMRIWPDTLREERSAVVWREPLDPTDRRIIGFDMLSDPVRREAMERARDAGAPALSGRTALVQRLEPGRPAGFMLFVPVYRGGAVPPTVAERRAALAGWMYSPFRTDELFSSVLPEQLVDFQVYDGAQVDADHLLRERRLQPAPDALVEQRALQPGGRTWTFVFATLPAFGRGSMTTVLVVIVGGLAVSLLVFLLSLLETRARQRAEDAVGELRKLLDERDRFEERLREEGRVNSILRRLGIALAAELDPDRLAQLVVDEAMSLTGAHCTAIIDTSAGGYRLLAQSGSPLAPPMEASQIAKLCGDAAHRIDDLSKEPRVPPHASGSFLSVPITSRTIGRLGALCFLHPGTGHFTEHHERLVAGLAAQASIALDNARLLRGVQESDRRKDEFLAVLGHELRNPLAPMVTALEVARRDPKTAERQMAIIERQARHMVRIVDDLLDTSRISRGKIELRKARLSVRDALARAADAVSPLARARHQKLTVSPPQNVQIDADPVRLEQILGNLLSNAVKYTPEGGSIDLSAEEHDGWLTIRVRDTGIGVPKEAQPTLFEPFVQVQGAKDYATGGLGIGLALVRGLVGLHGGSVSVQSEGAGKGTTFIVDLPFATEGATPIEVRKTAPRAQHGKVLVVDDNVDAALTLAEAVRLDGHEVRVAHEGESALREAADFAPDVVLLDIGLPGDDGYTVVRKLRQLAQLRGALMVALTGFGQDSDREKALKSGFDEHLVKPVDLDTVHSVLRRRLGAA